mgnify:CR=1 FL=1
MIVVDWTEFGLGMAAGVGMSAIFFLGLAVGMQRALQTQGTVRVLVLSAALRIALWLGVGWCVLTQAGPWAFAGYGIAFLVCRSIATTLARLAVPWGGAE